MLRLYSRIHHGVWLKVMNMFYVWIGCYNYLFRFINRLVLLICANQLLLERDAKISVHTLDIP